MIVIIHHIFKCGPAMLDPHNSLLRWLTNWKMKHARPHYHLTCGLQGDPFPTPFATPRGIGNSPPLVNFLWGTANLAVGVFILMRWLPAGAPEFGLLAVLVGFLASGTFMALHFARKAPRS